MCRHETATYACGHKEDLGFFCDYAQSYGPFFNKAGCPNYSHGPEKIDMHNQCGKQKGFYCALSQDGVVIDKAKDAMITANTQFAIKKADFERITLTCANYLQEAKTRGISNEELSKVPRYCELEKQRQLIGSQCTILRNRTAYFNGLLNHAIQNSARLAPGACHHPEWDRISFDFAHSIFPPHMLQPIRTLLPGYTRPQMPSAGPRFHDAMYQQQTQPQEMVSETHTALDHGAPPEPQVKPTRRPRLKVAITPTKQTTVTEEGPPVSSEIVRGNTPDGEDKKSKAARYLTQLTETRKEAVTGAMVSSGYDIGSHGIKPPGAQGYRLGDEEESTPTKNKSPPAGKKDPLSTPAKVRRSTRTRNNKPKYTDGSDNSFGSEIVSPTKSDSVWNDSPGKPDAAWVDTPTKSEASSSSPIRPTRARNNRTSQRLSRSPNSSPTQALLSSKISDYKRRTGSTISGNATNATAAATQFGNLFQSRTGATEAARNLRPMESLGEQHSQTRGMSSDNVYSDGIPQSSHTPQQRSAAVQRGSNLVQELGHNMYQHHLASGMVDTATADTTSYQTQQYGPSPGMGYAPQAQMLSGLPCVASPPVKDQLENGSPLPPVNFYNRNVNQARAMQSRSFSTGSVPHFNIPSQPLLGSPISPSSYGSIEASTARVDYENMRRSFSSNVDLTPQRSLPPQQPRSDAVPSKRSFPPASPTGGRKRQRLSLPGEDDAPTLTPSASKYQMYAPTGLPAADDDIDYAAQIAAIERFEKQNMADLAAFNTASSNVGSEPHQEHTNVYTAAEPSYSNPHAHQSIPVDPQLYQDPIATFTVQSTEYHSNNHHEQDTDTLNLHVSPTANPARDLAEDSSSPLSEPDWSLVNDEAYEQHYLAGNGAVVM